MEPSGEGGVPDFELIAEEVQGFDSVFLGFVVVVSSHFSILLTFFESFLWYITGLSFYTIGSQDV